MRRTCRLAVVAVLVGAAALVLPASPVAALHFDEMQKYEVASAATPDGPVECDNNFDIDLFERAFWMDGDVPGEPSPNAPFFLNDLEVILEVPFGILDPDFYDEATLSVLGGQEIALSDPEVEESFDDDAMWIIWTVPSALLAAPDTVGTHPIVPESFTYSIEAFGVAAVCDGFEDVGFADVTVVGPDEGPEGPPGPEGPEGPGGPPGADGTPGTDGADGTDGTDGEDGADGRDGVDGAGGGAGVLTGVGTAGVAAPVGATPTFTG